MCDNTDGGGTIIVILTEQLIRVRLGNQVLGGRNRGCENGLGCLRNRLGRRSVSGRYADVGHGRSQGLGEGDNTLNGGGRNEVGGHSWFVV
jgi:hypothetical protein